MNPVCYSALELDAHWTEQADSPGEHGTCPITQGTLTVPQRVLFTPAKRPQGQLWDNVYILHRNAYVPVTQFAYAITVEFPNAASIAACNAFEMDFQVCNGPTVFNWGWQFLIGTGLRIWDRATVSWVHQPVMQFPAFQPNVPLRVVAVFTRTNDTVQYLGMSLNGAWTPLDETFAALQQAGSLYINNAWQLDSKGQGAPIAAWMDNCNVVGF
jgi:hypothetical protein